MDSQRNSSRHSGIKPTPTSEFLEVLIIEVEFIVGEVTAQDRLIRETSVDDDQRELSDLSERLDQLRNSA